MRAVIDLALTCGWLVFHDQDSRKNAPGLPDLILCRPPRLIFAELKTARGQVREAQRTWLDALSACPGIQVYLWRPTDWSRIQTLLL